MTAQLVARDLGLAIGPTTIVDRVSMTVAPGHRIGVVGPNGVGKSTLLRLLAGVTAPTSGTVDRVPGDATVALLDQELAIVGDETVADLLLRRTGVADAATEFDAATTDLADDVGGAADRYDAALTRYLRLGVADFEARRDQVLERLGLPLGVLPQRAATLSGGQQARVGLAVVLLTTADVLLLDEPTNDLDLDGLAILERQLLAVDTGLVVVSHDREFLERVITSVVELDDHTRSATRFEGGYQAYLDLKATARRHAEQDYATYVDKRDQITAEGQQKREWAAKGALRARRSPSDGDKHVKQFNLAQSDKLAAKAKQAERKLDRLEVVDRPWVGWDLRLEFATSARSGAEVIRCRNLVVERAAFRLGPIDLDVGYGERIALVGSNGSGKSTLLSTFLGVLSPTAGTVAIGPSVVVGTLDQTRDRFASGAALIDAFVADTGVERTEARSQLAKLGLGADHIGRATADLSPGERTRAVLAAFAIRGVNLLVLDEPTNHLDLPAIEQLEAALDQYPGTLVVVSHDRRLLETVRLTRRVELVDGQVAADVPVERGGPTARS